MAQVGVYEARQQLTREEGEAALEEARQRIKLAALEKEHEMAMQSLDNAAKQAATTLAAKLTAEKATADQATALLHQKYELEKALTPTNLQKAMIDATKEVYEKLPLREVKLVSMGGGDGGLGGLLPRVAESWSSLQAGLGK